MYTVGYRLLLNVVGKEWANTISEKCKTHHRCRLNIPNSHSEKYVTKFYEFIGDEEVANKLISNFYGQRLDVDKFIKNTQRKYIHQAIDILLRSGFTREQLQATIIKADIELQGYQRKRSKKGSEQQMDLVI